MPNVFRSAAGLFLFALVCLLSSCVTVPTFEESTEKAVEPPPASTQLKNSEVYYLRKEIDELKGKLEKESEEKQVLKEKNKRLEGKVVMLSSSVKDQQSQQKSREEFQELQKRAKTVNVVKPRKPVPKMSAKTETARIKVLSGTGSLVSAQNLSARLQRLGFKVESTDMAPRQDFQETTIYYAPRYEDAANALAASLEEDCLVTELTWETVYDLIVVAGKGR